ncbi:MAG: sigma-70 family RNA polymerase sigma factor [Bacteroidetes bacterium]|nr:sigma-70 family RNA polymerase sigma factor [Bacteroidota bacterium]
METKTDEIWMKEVKEGNLESMIPLFEKYQVPLFNFFLRLTGNRMNSEDLAHTVFSRVMMYRESYTDGKSFRSWLYQMARNVHIDHYHKNKQYVNGDLIMMYKSADSADALEEMERNEKYNALYDALEQLTEEQKEIIELSRFQGLKYEEISEITGNSVPAIKVKVHRAMHKLREYYFQLV